jgi:chemotaxis protein CheC
MKTLNEISNQAALASTAALSRLLKRDCKIDVINCCVKNVEEMMLDSRSKERVEAVYLPVTGDISGSVLLIFGEAVAVKLCEFLRTSLGLVQARPIPPSGALPPSPSEETFPSNESILKEIGNIVAGNFLTVLANELSIRVMEGLPSASKDQRGAILEQVIASFIEDAKEGLVMEIKFIADPLELDGELILLLNHQHCQQI